MCNRDFGGIVMSLVDGLRAFHGSLEAQAAIMLVAAMAFDSTTSGNIELTTLATANQDSSLSLR